MLRLLSWTSLVDVKSGSNVQLLSQALSGMLHKNVQMEHGEFISVYNSAEAKTFKSTNMKQWLSKTKHLQSIEMSSVLFLF